jgi:acyl-CoA synthetase (AMP-forming)/AMP-acid ligase II
MLTHANLITSTLGAHATWPTVRPWGRLLHAAPMFHVAGLAGWVTQSIVGGTHMMVPKFDAVEVMTAIQRHRITNTVLVPTMIQPLVDHPDLEGYDLSSLQTVLYGGSAPGASLLRRAMKAFSQADFVQGYGMTELAPFATVLTAEDHRRGDRLDSAGRAAAHAEVRIVHDGNEAPRGTVGEVAVRGGHVMAGYWRTRPKRSVTDGCTPATPATWTTTAMSSSSTASRT